MGGQDVTVKKRVIVIGAGLGGLSAAISLAADGYDVSVYEKNERIGGKLNIHQASGFNFDMGPSIFTLPQYFQRLFDKAGRRLEDYVPLVAVEPHWRNFFEDGMVFDLTADRAVMSKELAKLGQGLEKQFYEFLSYSERQFVLIESGYFDRGLDTIRDFMKHYPLSRTFRMDFLRTMASGVRRYIDHPKLQDVFDFFIKYVGSSAWHAPGFMNLMPHIQFGFGLWYVDGGMYNLARGLERLMSEMSIPVHLNSAVTRIVTTDDRVDGIEVNGVFIAADVIVSNMEVIPVYERLTGESDSFIRKFRRFEPACSGLVIHLGLDREYPDVGHHNFLFSADQHKHFHTVFRDRKLPHDPTVYMVAPCRTDRTIAPPGHEIIKLLPHIPYINDRNPYTRDDLMVLKEAILDKAERLALPDLRKHIVLEHVWTPFDIQEKYNSTGGSIYGVVSDLWKNMALKMPQQSTKYKNLFFVGGSVNPGGGMPMVVLSGVNVAGKVKKVVAP